MRKWDLHSRDRSPGVSEDEETEMESGVRGEWSLDEVSQLLESVLHSAHQVRSSECHFNERSPPIVFTLGRMIAGRFP